MNRWGWAAKATAAVFAGASVLIGLATPVSAGAPDSGVSATGAQGFAQIAACAVTADSVLASIVVDSSGSLADTDPTNARVRAIGVALDSLDGLRSSSKGRLDVRASLSTFSTSFVQRVGWGSVGGSHGRALRTVADQQLPGAESGGTDYREALLGAQRSLDAQAKSLPGRSCKVLLWFTDGGLDVGADTAAARQQICEPQGIADSMRRDGIATIALALFKSGGSGGVTAADRDRLKAIAETSGGSYTCGTAPLPSSWSGGAYLRASDAGELSRLFAQAAALIGGATPGSSVTCPGSLCPDGALRIPFDRAISRFRLVLAPSAQPFTLTSPDGHTVTLTEAADGTTAGDGTLSVTQRDGLTTVDVQRGASARRGGVWTLKQPGVDATRVDLYYFWGISLTVSAPQKLIVGSTGTVSIAAREPDGSAVDPASLHSVLVKATVGGTDVHLDSKSPGVWTARVDVPSGDVAPSLHVSATARATSYPHGTPLGPITASADVSTSLPASFPTVGPARLVLSDVVGTKPATGSLKITGSADGTTRACLGAADLAGPAAAGTVSLTADSSCVTIPRGDTRSVAIKASISRPADGRVDGTLPVRITGAHGDSATLRVPVTFGLSRPVDEPVRWALVALFALLALGVAWAAAEIARRASDRYVLGTDARVASVPVLFNGDGITRAEPDRQDALLDPERDFESLGVLRRRRLARFDARGLHFKRSFSFWPTRAGRAVVSGDGSPIVIAPVGPRDLAIDSPGTRAQVDFPGSTGCVLTVDPAEVTATEGGSIRGRLLVIIDDRSGVSAVLPDRIEEIRSAGWDRVLDRVRKAAAHRAAKAAPAAPRRRAAAAAPAQPSVASAPAPAKVPGGWMDWTSETPLPAGSPRSGTSTTPARATTTERPVDDRDPFEAPPSSSSVNFLD